MATVAQNMALILALETEIPLFQKQLDDAYKKVKGETKPIWAREDNIKATKNYLNPKFNLKAACEAFQTNGTFKTLLGKLANIKANLLKDPATDPTELYAVTETVLTDYNILKKVLKRLNDNGLSASAAPTSGDVSTIAWGSWFPQYAIRAEKIFDRTQEAKCSIFAKGTIQTAATTAYTAALDATYVAARAERRDYASTILKNIGDAALTAMAIIASVGAATAATAYNELVAYNAWIAGGAVVAMPVSTVAEVTAAIAAVIGPPPSAIPEATVQTTITLAVDAAVVGIPAAPAPIIGAAAAAAAAVARGAAAAGAAPTRATDADIDAAIDIAIPANPIQQAIAKQLVQNHKKIANTVLTTITRAQMAGDVARDAIVQATATAAIFVSDPRIINSSLSAIKYIELNAYATIAKIALDKCYRRLVDIKTKPLDSTWWRISSGFPGVNSIDVARAKNVQRKADAELLLNANDSKSINGMRTIVYELLKQGTSLPADEIKAILTWLVQSIDQFYCPHKDLFPLPAIRAITGTSTYEIMKYVYNQLPILGYIGYVPTSVRAASVFNSVAVAPDANEINAMLAPSDNTSQRDDSLSAPTYDAIPPIPEIDEKFPDAGKIAIPLADLKEATKESAAKEEPKAVTDPALASDEIETLVQLDEQDGQDIWFFGQRPLKLPRNDLPSDWKMRPPYRQVSDQLNLINYAKQTNKGDDWIKAIFKEINMGCTSDRRIMYSTKCPTFRTYLEEMATYRIDGLGDFTLIAPETPDAESYGDVTITLLIDLSSLKNAFLSASVSDSNNAASASGSKRTKQPTGVIQEILDTWESIDTAWDTISPTRSSNSAIQAIIDKWKELSTAAAGLPGLPVSQNASIADILRNAAALGI